MENSVEQINLYDLLLFYVKRWYFVVLLTLGGLLAGFLYNTYIQVPQYKSNTKLLLAPTQVAQSTSSQTLINNYTDLIRSRRVLETVIDKQNNSKTYEDLLDEVSVVTQKDSAVIDVVVTTNSAKQSADIANQISDSFKSAVKSLYQTSDTIVVDPAVEATQASNVNKPLQLIVSSVGFFALAVVILFWTYDYRRSHSPGKKLNLQTITEQLTEYTGKSVSEISMTRSKRVERLPLTRFTRIIDREIERLPPDQAV